MQSQNKQIISQIGKKIEEAKSILILVPQNHTADNLAAGLSLYLSLKKQDKNITIATPTQVTVSYQRLYGVNKIQTEMGSKSLVITLGTDYDNIEKVTYDNDSGKFNLVVETKKGVKKLAKENIDFSYRGVDADLIISLGFSTQEDAGNLLIKEPNLFSDREHIMITNNPNAVEFGTICCKEGNASGVCEIVAKLIRHSHFHIDQDIATNIIAGIESATNNFTIKTSADTFAAISWCMRNNGKRNHLTQVANTQPIPAKQFKQQINPSQNQFQPQINQVQQPVQNPVQNVQPPQFVQQAQPQQQPTQTQQNDEQPKKDWYEPKIYRGSTKV